MDSVSDEDYAMILQDAAWMHRKVITDLVSGIGQLFGGTEKKK